MYFDGNTWQSKIYINTRIYKDNNFDSRIILC